MAMVSKRKVCSNTKCGVELVNANGIHMGIAFGLLRRKHPTEPQTHLTLIVCSKCYDEMIQAER